MRFRQTSLTLAGLAALAVSPFMIEPTAARPTGTTAMVAPELVPSPRPDRPDRLTGIAHVVDGDTIDVAGRRIRLEGIDAPETGQTCERRNREPWACGTDATGLLLQLVGRAEIACVVRGSDVYGRALATCYNNGRDINAEMVRQGLAWAFVKYSSTYVAEEAAARRSGLGIWQGTAQEAWAYRASRWTQASETAPAGCAIKGNVSHSGRIYHMPWSPWYGKVVMRSDKGTRWFCSETEAQAAGWRPVQGY
jgi:endonuclease YncB( thermonuclease family)